MALSDLVKSLLGFRIRGHKVNRGVLVVVPKGPFVRWLAGLDEELAGEAHERAGEERTAYLLPIAYEGTPEPEVMKAVWRYVFEKELSDWTGDKRRWPQNRTRKMFEEWFEVRWSDEVLDLCREPLEREAGAYEAV